MPQSRGIHAAVAFVLGATCVPLVESSLVPTSSASFTAATANLPVGQPVLMTSQISYGEAWLLEALTMYRLPMWCLTQDRKSMEEWLNRGFHELALGDRKRVIRTLFDAGEIDANIIHDNERFTPSVSQIEAAFR